MKSLALPVVLLAACGPTRALIPPTHALPARLEAPAGETLNFEALGQGVVRYDCRDGGWVAGSAEAKLYDGAGRAVGRQDGGPTWELADGSRVVGEVVAEDPGPDPSALPWQLLRPKATAGAGVLTPTESIQRVDTHGGGPPATPCAEGAEADVDFRATYRFRGPYDAAREPRIAPEAAMLLSLGATVAGVGVGIVLMGSDSDSIHGAGGLTILGSTVIFPSLGRAIGGDGGGALGFIGARALAVFPGALVGGFFDGVPGAVLLPAVTVCSLGLVDIFTTPSALRPRSLEIVPASVGDRRAPGLVLVGSF
jgi:hypothetical protein